MALERILRMADVSLFGIVDDVRVDGNVIRMVLLERRAGYKRKDGVVVEDEVVRFEVMFKSFMRNYVLNCFPVGSLVRVKGVFLPYKRCVVDGADVVRGGYTIFGQTLDAACVPYKDMKRDVGLLRSGRGSKMDAVDGLEDFRSDDF